eukprot:TRINITY_DN20700_c0_g1_i2.p1 TRINITY_DN20700_c0_g1~~TRINITY_DN20700_c0_g1_i2.p1  ORF type:complete len:719 (-),score=250.10 TRINITY_DN20700_c0_g1_i2:77-2233(-)
MSRNRRQLLLDPGFPKRKKTFGPSKTVKEEMKGGDGVSSENGIPALPPLKPFPPKVDMIVDMEEDHEEEGQTKERGEAIHLDDDGGDMEDAVIVEDSSAGRRFKKRRTPALPPLKPFPPKVDMIVDMEEDHEEEGQTKERGEAIHLDDDGGDMEDAVIVEDSSAGRRFKKRRTLDDDGDKEDIDMDITHGRDDERKSSTKFGDEWDLHFDSDGDEDNGGKMDGSECLVLTPDGERRIVGGTGMTEDANGMVLLDLGPSTSPRHSPSLALRSSVPQSKPSYQTKTGTNKPTHADTHSYGSFGVRHLTSSRPHLPLKFEFLLEQFRALETALSFLLLRRQATTFTALKQGVEQISKRTFTKDQLAQIIHVYPDAYFISARMEKIEDSAGITKLHEELFIRPRFPLSCHDDDSEDDVDSEGKLKEEREDRSKLPRESDTTQPALGSLTPHRLEMLPRTDRLKHFLSSLIDLVSKKHTSFLKSLPENERGKRIASTWWHPRFSLKSVPDVPCGELPHAERYAAYTFKTLARDVAESDARMRQQIQIQHHELSAASSSSFETERLKPDLTEEKSDSASREKCNPFSLSSLRARKELQGLSPALLTKIRQRQQEKIENEEKAVSDISSKRKRIRGLTVLAECVKSVFSRKSVSSMHLPTLVEESRRSYPVDRTHDEMRRDIMLLASLCPDWCQLKDLLTGGKTFQIIKADAFVPMKERLRRMLG